MRSEVAKNVRKIFQRELQREIPQFTPIKDTNVRGGDSLFRWQIHTGMNAYIYLFVSPKYGQDRFAIDLACSPGEFPKQMPRGPSDEKNGSVRFRLPQLYKDQWPRKNWEPMWEVGPHNNPRLIAEQVITGTQKSQVGDAKDEGLLPFPQSLGFVEPQVRDAVDKIKEFGIPFFKRFAERKKPVDI